MYEEYWEAAKNFGDSLLRYTDSYYHLKFSHYYKNASEGGKYNEDKCRLPRFIVNWLAKKHENLSDDNMIEKGLCSQFLAKVDEFIRDLPPDSGIKLDRLKPFVSLEEKLILYRDSCKWVDEQSKPVECTRSRRKIREYRRNDMAAIKRFNKKVLQMKAKDCPPEDILKMINRLR